MRGSPDHFAVELVPKPIFAFLDNLGEGETFLISSSVFSSIGCFGNQNVLVVRKSTFESVYCPVQLLFLIRGPKRPELASARTLASCPNPLNAPTTSFAPPSFALSCFMPSVSLIGFPSQTQREACRSEKATGKEPLF